MAEPNAALHQMLVTENSQYHIVDGVCVAVRDHRSGHWHTAHNAIGSRVVGSLRTTGEGSIQARLGNLEIGERVIFESDVVTSPLLTIETGDPNMLDSMPLLGAA